MRRQVIFASLVICVGLSGAPAFAKTVRCETVSKTDKLVPDWIEYTVRETDVDVKDPVQKQFKTAWRPGRVASKSAKRMTIAWEVGPIETDRFWHPGDLQLRLSHFSDGSFRITASSDRLRYANSQPAMEGRGKCK